MDMDIIQQHPNMQNAQNLQGLQSSQPETLPENNQPNQPNLSNLPNLPNLPADLAVTVPQSKMALLADTLQLYGYKASPENVQMLLHMLDSGLPLTKENIAAMHQALKMTANLDRAAFLLQNNIPVTAKNASILAEFSQGTGQINQQITTLLESIAQLKDATLQQNLLQLFNSIGQPKPEPANLSTVNSANSAQNLQNLPNGINPQNPQNPQNVANTANPANMPNPQNLANAENPTNPANPTNPTATQPPQNPQQNNAVPVRIIPQPMSVGSAVIADLAAHVSENAQPQQAANSPLPQAMLRSSNVTVNNIANFNSPAEPPPAAQPAPPPVTSNNFGNIPTMQTTQAMQTVQTIQTMQTTQTEPQQILQPTQQPPASPETALPPTLNIATIQEKLSFDWQNGSAQDLERFINEIREILAQAISLESTATEPTTARVMQDIQTLAEYIDFTAQLRNQILVQVPIIINDQIFNTALYANKDKASKKSKNAAQTALIALDTAFLGHFETLLKKERNAVQLQFRLENQNIENLVRENIHKLNDGLREHQYILESFSFIVNDKPFNILDKLGELGETGEKKAVSQNTLFDATA